jgi:hypothetical protein
MYAFGDASFSSSAQKAGQAAAAGRAIGQALVNVPWTEQGDTANIASIVASYRARQTVTGSFFGTKLFGVVPVWAAVVGVGLLLTVGLLIPREPPRNSQG